MEFQEHTLSNGIKVIHLETKGSPVSHCGLLVNVGSRDEAIKESGITHFIEHCIFKGTKKRKAYHILNRMEVVGGELNAYTTKEETCIYASFLSEHYGRAVELIADITLNSIFPEKEIQKEKEVIIDEINSYLDDPYELIFDEFEEKLFKSHAIGRPILGNKKTVKRITRNQLIDFTQRKYHSNNLYFSSVGNISLKRLVNQLEKHFQSCPAGIVDNDRIAFNAYTPFDETKAKRTFQTHSVIGCPAYAANHENRRALILLNNMLGGPGMNSRLNMEIREKHGLTYNIESNYTSYSDTGIFSIYYGCDKKNSEKAQQLIHKELQKLMHVKLGTSQLNLAKKQLIGQIALGQESKVNLMLAIGKSKMLYNKVDSLETIFNQIEQISATDIMAIANELFNEQNLSTLTYQSK